MTTTLLDKYLGEMTDSELDRCDFQKGVQRVASPMIGNNSETNNFPSGYVVYCNRPISSSLVHTTG